MDSKHDRFALSTVIDVIGRSATNGARLFQGPDRHKNGGAHVWSTGYLKQVKDVSAIE